MAELTEAANVAADVAEVVSGEVLDAPEEAIAWATRDTRVLLFGLGLGLLAGAVAGGFVTNKRLYKKYQEIADKEIDEMREHYQARMIAREEKPPLSEMAKEHGQIVEDQGYSTPNTGTQDKELNDAEPEEAVEGTTVGPPPEGAEEEVLEGEEVKNVFADAGSKDSDENWDYEEEVRLRRPDRPYIIHQDERGENEYTVSSLVYYADDEVLTTEDDSIIEDKEKVVGLNNLEKFGHGTDDKNVIYVRNDVLGIEVEVVKNDGNYAEHVHGFKHSDEPEHHRRRRFDDDSPSAA